MGLTKRKDSYYVEFHVLDDGKTFTLARGVAGAKLKRWKVSSLNKTVAKQQEALIKRSSKYNLNKCFISLVSACNSIPHEIHPGRDAVAPFPHRALSAPFHSGSYQARHEPGAPARYGCGQ